MINAFWPYSWKNQAFAVSFNIVSGIFWILLRKYRLYVPFIYDRIMTLFSCFLQIYNNRKHAKGRTG